MRVLTGRPSLGESFGWLKAEKEKGKEDFRDAEVDGDKVQFAQKLPNLHRENCMSTYG